MSTTIFVEKFVDHRKPVHSAGRLKRLGTASGDTHRVTSSWNIFTRFYVLSRGVFHETPYPPIVYLQG